MSSVVESSSSGAHRPLRVVFSSAEDHLQMHQELHMNKPALRRSLILSALRQAAESNPCITFDAVTQPASSLSAAERVHDPRLVELFATGWQRWEALGADRDLYFSNGGKIDPENWEELVPSQIAPRDSLQRPGNSLHGQICYFAQDTTTPLTRTTSAILHHDMAVLLQSVRAIQSGDARHVYACTAQPGHHSGRQSYGGYCYLNMAAIAATHLVDSHSKVALIDVDYHAGNGSMSIFYSSPSVLFASLHAHPDIDYPYCCGWEDQTGEGEGVGSTINVPLPKNTTWAEYEPHLRRVMASVASFGAQAIVVSLGVDTLAADPETAPLAGFQLHPADYARMGEIIRAAGLPTLWVQEGGYKMDQLAEAVVNVVAGAPA